MGQGISLITAHRAADQINFSNLSWESCPTLMHPTLRDIVNICRQLFSLINSSTPQPSNPNSAESKNTDAETKTIPQLEPSPPSGGGGRGIPTFGVDNWTETMTNSRPSSEPGFGRGWNFKQPPVVSCQPGNMHCLRVCTDSELTRGLSFVRIVLKTKTKFFVFSEIYRMIPD